MRTPSIILAILLLSTFAYAASISVTPTSIYETTSVWETLDVNNYKSTFLITKVTVNSPTLTITDAESYLGWTTEQDADTALWKDGSIATNVKSALFEFQVSAPNVSTNKTATLTISLDSASTTFNITILNDATPPDITEIKPNGYAKANNAVQPVSANVIDSETDVDTVTYSWNNCAGGTDEVITLSKNNNTYSGMADFSAFDEGSKACYKITAKNKAGETATAEGELMFDGTPPEVNLIAPTTFATESTTFTFNATDNLASTLACQLKLDSTEIGTINATNGTTATLTEDLTAFDQGSHTWSVTCADGVGLINTHVQAIVLDKEPPTILYDGSLLILRTQSTSFAAEVTDTIGLASVDATYEGNTITLTKDGDKYKGSISSDTLGFTTLTITAKDDAGHMATINQSITVVPNHQVTLSLSPASAAPGESITASGTLTKDGNATATTLIIKTPDENITLDLSSDGYSTTFNAPSSGTYTITAEYIEGGYTYTAQKTLVVSSSNQQAAYYTSGIGAEAWRNNGYVKPGEQQDNTNSEQQTEQQPQTESSQPSQPAPQYQPLPAEEPRSALTPKATGIFTLGKAIKWLSLLLALALLLGLGAYAYSKRPPKNDGKVNWDGYFNGP